MSVKTARWTGAFAQPRQLEVQVVARVRRVVFGRAPVAGLEARGDPGPAGGILQLHHAPRPRVPHRRGAVHLTPKPFEDIRVDWI